MDVLLAAPAALIIVVAIIQIHRARADRKDTLLDLRTPPTPRVELEYLMAEPRIRREVSTPVLEGRNLGARMLAAHEQRTEDVPHPAPKIRLRRRGEALSAR